MNPESIIIAPVLSEKSSGLKERGKYVFSVALDANKRQVLWAVSALYNVKVVKCSIIRVKPKEKKQGKFVGTTSRRKKAIVTLAKGQNIPIFEGA